MTSPPTIVLTQEGFIIPEKDIKAIYGAHYSKFLNKLTVRTKQKVGPDKVARIYKKEYRNGSYMLFLPRGPVERMLRAGYISCDNRLRLRARVEFNFEGELSENQQIVVDHLVANYFNEKRIIKGFATCTLNMRAGMGKTYVASGLIARLGFRALYIVSNKDLRKQARDDLMGCFPANSVLGAESSYAIKEAKEDVVVAVINSVLNCGLEALGDFGLIIFDEVHSYCSPQRSSVFWMLQAPCMLGMSATTSDRRDGFDAVYHKHLGEPLPATEIPGFSPQEIEFTGLVRQIKYYGHPNYTKNIFSDSTGKLFTPDMDKQFASDPYRNQLIVDLSLDLLGDPARNIFIFSQSRDHLDVLEEMLRGALKEGDVFAPELVKLRGGIKEKERELAQQARVILTTYSYSGQGVSIPKMNSAIFATPRRNGFIQICARIMRKGGDPSISRIFIDIVDWLTGVKSQFYSRKNAYLYYNMKIAQETIAWDRKKEN